MSESMPSGTPERTMAGVCESNGDDENQEVRSITAAEGASRCFPVGPDARVWIGTIPHRNPSS